MTVVAVTSPVVVRPPKVMVQTVGGVKVGHVARQNSKHPPQVWPQSSVLATQTSGQLMTGGRGGRGAGGLVTKGRRVARVLVGAAVVDVEKLDEPRRCKTSSISSIQKFMLTSGFPSAPVLSKPVSKCTDSRFENRAGSGKAVPKRLPPGDAPKVWLPWLVPPRVPVATNSHRLLPEAHPYLKDFKSKVSAVLPENLVPKDGELPTWFEVGDLQRPTLFREDGREADAAPSIKS